MSTERRTVDLVTTLEVSKILHMSREWVSKLASRGEFASIRPGKRKILIKVDSLKEYLISKGMEDIATNLEATILKIREEKS